MSSTPRCGNRAFSWHGPGSGTHRPSATACGRPGTQGSDAVRNELAGAILATAAAFRLFAAGAPTPMRRRDDQLPFTTIQPGPGSNVAILAPMAVESLPRLRSYTLPLWLTMNVITPLRPYSAG